MDECDELERGLSETEFELRRVDSLEPLPDTSSSLADRDILLAARRIANDIDDVDVLHAVIVRTFDVSIMTWELFTERKRLMHIYIQLCRSRELGGTKTV